MILKERGNESSYGCYRIAMITSVCDCILFGAVQNQKNILVPCGYDITPDGYPRCPGMHQYQSSASFRI